MHIMANTRNQHQRQNYNQHHQYLHHHYHDNHDREQEQVQKGQQQQQQQQKRQRQKDFTKLATTKTPQQYDHYYYNSEAVGNGDFNADAANAGGGDGDGDGDGNGDHPYNNNTNNNSSKNTTDDITTSADNNNDSTPYQREVREWQHIDPDTGALLTGRLETDRWANGRSHIYGKISDSQNISQPNGTQQSKRKQVEVLQASTTQGAMQLIRAQTIQTTSSRCWSMSTSSMHSNTPLIRLSSLSLSTSASASASTSTSTSSSLALVTAATTTKSAITSIFTTAVSSSSISTPPLPMAAQISTPAIKQSTDNKLVYNKNDNKMSIRNTVRENEHKTKYNITSASSSSSSPVSSLSLTLSACSRTTSPTALLTNCNSNGHVYERPEATIPMQTQTSICNTRLLLLDKQFKQQQQIQQLKQLKQLQLDNGKVSSTACTPMSFTSSFIVAPISVSNSAIVSSSLYRPQQLYIQHYGQKNDPKDDDNNGNDDDMSHNSHVNDTLTIVNPYLVNNFKIGNDSKNEKQQHENQKQKQQQQEKDCNKFNGQQYYNEVVDNCDLMTKCHSVGRQTQEQQQHKMQNKQQEQQEQLDASRDNNICNSSFRSQSNETRVLQSGYSHSNHRHNNNNNNNNNKNSNNNHEDSNQFLLNAAPSFKLSNLMKTNTNCSSNNSGIVNTVIASTIPIKNALTTYKSDANQKISLSSIVGHSNNTRNGITDTKSVDTIWNRQKQQQQDKQQQHQSEQLNSLFRLNSSINNNNNNNNNINCSYNNKHNYNNPSSSSNYSQNHSRITNKQSHLLENRCVGFHFNYKPNDINANAHNDARHDDEFRTFQYNTITKPIITNTNTTTMKTITTTAATAAATAAAAAAAIVTSIATITTVTVTSRDDHQCNQIEQQQLQKSLSHNLEINEVTPIRQQHESIQQKRDLENFRFGDYDYDHKRNTFDDDTKQYKLSDNCDIRFLSRYDKRQQIPVLLTEIVNPLHKSRSASTDDLSGDCNPCSEDVINNSDEQPGLWHRVSKLRRSFQSAHKSNDNFKPSSVNRKPLDLPINSVSVAKIRAELENNYQANTAVVKHSNRIAIQGVDDTTKVTQLPIQRKDSLLTTNSLKEIRHKLKKVSDESQINEENRIHQSKQEIVKSIVNKTDNIDDRFRLFNAKKEENPTLVTVTGKHASHSLESRLKYREPNSIEWHLRRKSYGFEKMSPPENKVLPSLDNSTDSGLGRSSELNNWSPTSDISSTAISPNRNSTIIHFESSNYKSNPSNIVQRLYTRITEKDQDDSKRHSIALDERQYSTDNLRQTTQVRLNGTLYEPNIETHSSSTVIPKGSSKRVEFCKTEVHFATESGRVNIVETDSKPPPTNNFRRRRRSSSMGPLQRLTHDISTVRLSPTPATSDYTRSTSIPITLFSDTEIKRNIVAPTISEITHSKDSTNNVTISVPCQNTVTSNSCISNNISDNVDCDLDDLSHLRGILKNKPIKPKPYVLGENIENASNLWGQQQQKRFITINKDTENSQYSTSVSADIIPKKIVSDRIRLVEQNQQKPLQHDLINNSLLETNLSNTFSTKINVSLGNTEESKNDLSKSNVMSIKLNALNCEKNSEDADQISNKRITASNTTSTIAKDNKESGLIRKDSLKIIKEARGARQLREHELSYFGVPTSKTTDQTLKSKLYSKPQNAINLSKRSLPSRSIKDDWLNDEPESLKHQAFVIEKPKAMKRTSILSSNELDTEDEHLYENIANEVTSVFKIMSSVPSPTSLSSPVVHASPPTTNNARQLDLERDVRILNEMNRNADQSLKEIETKRNEKVTLKNRLHNSLPRNKLKLLETISEKNHDASKFVKLIRGTYSSEAKRTTKHETFANIRERTSSQSSIDCCPRARSRSLSSEKEYETVKTKNVRLTNTKPTANWSNSSESRISSYAQQSSSEEQQLESSGRKDRIRNKTKRLNVPTSYSTSTQLKYNSSDDMKRSNTKYSSTNRERSECQTGQSNYHQPTKAVLKRSTSGSTRRSKLNPKIGSLNTQNTNQNTVQRIYDKRNETVNKVATSKSNEQLKKRDFQHSEEEYDDVAVEKPNRSENSKRLTIQQCQRNTPKTQTLRHIKQNKKLTNDEATSSKNVTIENCVNIQQLQQQDQLNHHSSQQLSSSLSEFNSKIYSQFSQFSLCSFLCLFKLYRAFLSYLANKIDYFLITAFNSATNNVLNSQRVVMFDLALKRFYFCCENIEIKYITSYINFV